MKRVALQDHIEALRREAFSAGYAAAMRGVREFIDRPIPGAAAKKARPIRYRRATSDKLRFASEDDRFDYWLEHDPRFLARIERARADIRAGRGVRLEDIALE